MARPSTPRFYLAHTHYGVGARKPEDLDKALHDFAELTDGEQRFAQLHVQGLVLEATELLLERTEALRLATERQTKILAKRMVELADVFDGDEDPDGDGDVDEPEDIDGTPDADPDEAAPAPEPAPARARRTGRSRTASPPVEGEIVGTPDNGASSSFAHPPPKE